VKDTKTPPPLVWKGPLAQAIRSRLLDYQRCHSCATVIKKGDEWRAIGHCPTTGKPSIVFFRLCLPCWGNATVGIDRMRRAW